MEIYTVEQMKTAEKTADQSGLSYLRMMENAGCGVANFIAGHIKADKSRLITFLVGTGNNGGDGYVAARKLQEKGYRTCVVLLQGEPTSQCAIAMADRLSGTGVTVANAAIQSGFVRQLLTETQLFVDCVYGTGFHGQLPSGVREWFRQVARTGMPVVGVDVPSGVCADTGEVAEDTLVCQATIAFHGYKYGHVLYPGRNYCGTVVVADIGIAPQSDPKTPFVIEKAQVKTWIKRKSGDTHKGTFGKAGLLVGSKGMSGAAALSARACLRCGVGLCVPIVPECIYPMVSAAAPEAVYRVYDQAASAGQVAQSCMDSNALLVGCGLSVNSFSKAVCRELVLSYPGPLVLDADGINSLVGHIDVLKRREGVTLLTPHPGEMAGLLRCDVAKVQANRLETAREFARETGAITVLKGASTVIASPDGRVAVSLTGNSGLSKGGSGDVLAGMMVSLLAQGVPGFESACAAVWLHGKAGDLAARRLSVRGMLPSDVVDGLPSLFLEIEEQ